MPQYTVYTDTRGWGRYTVEAANLEEAKEKYYDGDCSFDEGEITEEYLDFAERTDGNDEGEPEEDAEEEEDNSDLDVTDEWFDEEED